jgi:hypothetical protein
LFGQNQTITIKVNVPNKKDIVYITGNQYVLGNWKENKVKMIKSSDFERVFEFTPKEYPIEFKFTKGSWESEAEILKKFDEGSLKINEYVKDTIFTVFRWISDSRLDELKKAKNYNLSDNRFVPKFQYQDKNHPDLIKVRTQLKLDSIAGNGSELTKVFNVLDWLHKTIHHDCCTAFSERNAISLIHLGKEKGMNCRMLAITLNECLLSLGIKSRYVTCKPKEEDFMDCHVINSVYINDLKKWIWIDPSIGGFAMNEKGNLLSIEEVREKLTSDKPVILNANASWNKENLETTNHYFYEYMAKNLYRMESPLVSQSDAETWKNQKEVISVELLPLDAKNQEPQKVENINSKTGTKFINYKTNNPNIFWENR